MAEIPLNAWAASSGYWVSKIPSATPCLNIWALVFQQESFVQIYGEGEGFFHHGYTA